jgi:hypothetical protein
LSITEEDALEKYKKMRPEIQGEDIKKYFYIKEDKIPPDTYGNFFELTEDGLLNMDIRKFVSAKKAEQVRLKRNSLLQKLDLPFMIALEEEDEDLKSHLKKLKSFLRDLPNELKFNDIKDKEDIIKYNPFGNIFDIKITNQGVGYEHPPRVTVDPPKGVAFGFQTQALAMIKDGKVSRIEVIDYGSAYDYIPKVTIEPPKEGKQASAICAPPQNSELTPQDFVENTKKYYL